MPGSTYHYRYASMSALQPRLALAVSTWLAEDEQAEFAGIRHPARRMTWLAGRILGKRLLASCLRRSGYLRSNPDFRDLQVVSNGRPPRARFAGEWLPWSLSISHTDTGVLAAVSRHPGASIGVDLVAPRPLTPGFGNMWFTPRERRWLTEDATLATRGTILWGMKEAVYKAMRCHTGFRPQRIEIQQIDNTSPCFYYGRSLDPMHAPRWCRVWWRETPQRDIAVFATALRGHCHD